MNVIKHQYIHQNRLSTSIFTDLEATKTLCESICLNFDGRLKGMIQEINFDPFGFLLFSNIQV